MSDVRIRTTNLDAVGVAAPLNREAATVRDGSGDAYTPNKKIDCSHWDAPPKPIRSKPDAAESLEGRQFGRLTVVRYHDRSASRGSLWLVRCACGQYEARRTKAILNPANSADACQLCRHLMFLQREDGRNKGRARLAADAVRLDSIAAKARAS